MALPDLDRDLPVLPLRGMVLFPGVALSLDIGRPKTVALAEHLAKEKHGFVLVVSQKDAAVEDPDKDDLARMGVVARVVGLAKRPTGNYAILVQGLARVSLSELTQTSPFLRAKVTLENEPELAADPELDALGLALREKSAELFAAVPQLSREVAASAQQAKTPGALADLIAGHVEGSVEEKLELLATLDPKARAKRTLAALTRLLETLAMKARIDEQVKGEMGKTQREHLLRQQLKAIKDELEGEDGEDADADLDALAKRIADAKLPPEAEDVAKKQLKRLKGMRESSSPEHAQTRNYLEWILDLPWTHQSDDATDLAAVRAILEADHYGLERVKRRILEFLAVRKLKGATSKGPILCLVGPPGVGKTSLAKSVARALGRKLHRISLGGVHDEAAIRGHRRTYVGALPGQIIQGMKKVGTTNPVFVLDEVDKLGRDFRGDPSSALLEVLDPEQNSTFADHYLEIPYDLSRVMFIATANVSDTIPPPLRDRMEVIDIAGYTRREKHAIARRHLVPKQLGEHGLTVESFEITDEALEIVIDRYTREAGVRSLERQVAALARAAAVAIAEQRTQVKRLVATEEDVRAVLGPARFTSEIAERTEDPGVATGLAWTPVGGEILFVEATKMPGSGKLTLTGQLGDVMKESAQAALSWVRASSDRLGLSPGAFEKSDVHVHVPAGAMPKDGPSAGVTMLSALASIATGVRVRGDTAMTGEITLRGRVLPIGGLKEKLVAAHRAGIKRVIVPERNRHDLDEVPDEVKRDLELVFVSTMTEVLDAALDRAAIPIAPPRAADAASPAL